MQDKKYELTKNTRIVNGIVLYKIRALKDFNNVKRDDIGGWIESEINLSHSHNAWVYGNAEVFGNATVFDSARVCGNAKVCDNAKVYGNAEVCDSARVYGNAEIYDSALVYDNTKIFDSALVYGNAKVFDKARVFGNARVYDSALVYGNAEVYNKAKVFGNAEVFSNAEIKERSRYVTGFITKAVNKRQKLIEQCFTAPIGNKVILYKRVIKVKQGVYHSCYDDSFYYYDNKIAKVLTFEKSNQSCTTGLHFSYPTYWSAGDTLIAAEIRLRDIITIQEGKVRCSKCKVIGEIKY